MEDSPSYSEIFEWLEGQIEFAQDRLQEHLNLGQFEMAQEAAKDQVMLEAIEDSLYRLEGLDK